MSKMMIKFRRQFNMRVIFDIAILIYLIFNQLHYIFAFTGLMQLFVVGTINIIGIIMLFITMYKKMDLRLLITTMILIIFASLTSLFVGNFGIIAYTTVLRYMGIAMYLLHYKQNKKIMTIMMYTTLVLFIPVLFQRLGYNMFSKSSRNYYSIILILANFIYNKSFWDVKRKAPIFPTIASLFICLFAGGRGGIISYVFLLIGTLIQNFKLIKENPREKILDDLSDTREIPIITDKDIEENTFKKRKIFKSEIYKKEIAIIIIILLVFSVLFSIKYINKKDNLFNFNIPNVSIFLEDNVTDSSYGFEGKGIKSNTRLAMIEKYFTYMFSDINYFLNGVKLDKEPLYVDYGFNLHNSFLGLHAKFGLGGVLLCAYLGIRALFVMIKRKEWGHLFIYIAILFRVSLDTAAFPGHLDIIIFYYFFKFYYIDKHKYKTIDVKKYLKELINKNKKQKNINLERISNE